MPANSKSTRNEPRQRPVSCDFCIKRKLRCSRETPCSNCSSRGSKCSFLSAKLSEPNSSARRNPYTENNLPSQAELIEWVQKLERVVRLQQQPTASGVDENAQQGVLQSQSEGSLMYANVGSEIAALETISTTNSAPNTETNALIFSTRPVDETEPSVFEMYRKAGEIFQPIVFPVFSEATSLLEKYISDISSIYPVVHAGTIRQTLMEFFESLEQTSRTSASALQNVDLGHAALILSILANASFFWTATDAERYGFFSMDDARKFSPLWLKAAEDVLHHAEMRNLKSLETIQAMICICLVKSNVDGISLRCRTLFSSGITMARELGLHSLDKADPEKSHRDIIRDETCRRVWWYLAASDWMLASFPGPAEGTYTVHKTHMTIQRPLNINDSDLNSHTPPIERPISELTIMSYFLQRLRLTEVVRDGSDRLNAATSPCYSDTISFDTAMLQFRDTVPAFFDLTLDDNPSHAPPTQLTHTTPWMESQQYTLNCMFHTQLCKVHIRYFALGYHDALYAYSRDVCLREAKLIVRTETRFKQDESPFALSRLRYLGMLYGVHMANIVFLLDAYICKCSGRPHEWPVEAVDALGILQNARVHSEIAVGLCDKTEEAMRKYDLRPPVPQRDAAPVCDRVEGMGSSASKNSGFGYGLDGMQPDRSGLQTAPDTPQLFDFSNDFEMAEWAGLFGGIGLEMPFI